MRNVLPTSASLRRAQPSPLMTKLLERAFSEAAALPEAEQDAIAARILAEIEDERGWDSRFAATSDEQWDKLAAKARREIEDEGSAPLDDVIRGRSG